MTKYFIIGDIHGCYDELRDLLELAALSPDDHIISIGDMVNKGPSNARVLDFFRQNIYPNVYSIMGNHEYKHLQAYRGEAEPTLPLLLTRWQLDSTYDNAIDYMSSLPTYIELPDAVLVHGYYEPEVPLEDQPPHIMVGATGADKYLASMYKKPWYKYYKEEKPLIVGHKDMSGDQNPFNYKDRVYGIDTGCVYGGSLTGLLLPDFKFISVPSRQEYWQEISQRYSAD